MTHLKLVIACCFLSCALQANAETLNFTGTFQDYKLLGVAINLTGVGPDIATWPAYDSNIEIAGVQPLTFSVAGTIDVTNGVVTAAIINQTTVLQNDYEGAGVATRGAFNGLSWTDSGGNTLSFTPLMAVTGTCTIIVGAGTSSCATALSALQAVDNAVSAWSWQGIPDPFPVSRLFGLPARSNVNVGPHAGVVWTVTGNTVTGLVTQSLPGSSAGFNSTYAGTFSLQTVAGPTAVDDGPVSVLPAIPVQIDVLENDIGFTDPVTVTLGTLPARGTAVVNGSPGAQAAISITYTANVGASGADTFTYTVDDGLASDSATVTVGNEVPSASPGTITSISTEGVDPAVRTGTFTAPGPGGSLGNNGTVEVTQAPSRGTAIVNGADITYTPGSNFFAGDDTFTYTITDADGETSSAQVSVLIASVAPTIPDARIVTNEGTASPPLNPGITLGNGAEFQHTLVVDSQAAHGSCAVSPADASGLVTYTPNAGYFGSDSCALRITDGDGQFDSSTVTITVNQVVNGSGSLSGGSSAADPWLLSLLSGLAFLRRRRQS